MRINAQGPHLNLKPLEVNQQLPRLQTQLEGCDFLFFSVGFLVMPLKMTWQEFLDQPQGFPVLLAGAKLVGTNQRLDLCL